LVGAYTMVTTWDEPGPIVIPMPPPSSVKGGVCFGAEILAINGPVPVLLMVMLAEAVAIGIALRFTFLRLTEICPSPGVGVAEGVADTVAVAVAVAVGEPVGVRVLVAEAVGDAVAVGVGVADESGLSKTNTRLLPVSDT